MVIGAIGPSVAAWRSATQSRPARLCAKRKEMVASAANKAQPHSMNVCCRSRSAACETSGPTSTRTAMAAARTSPMSSAGNPRSPIRAGTNGDCTPKAP